MPCPAHHTALLTPAPLIRPPSSLLGPPPTPSPSASSMSSINSGFCHPHSSHCFPPVLQPHSMQVVIVHTPGATLCPIHTEQVYFGSGPQAKTIATRECCFFYLPLAAHASCSNQHGAPCLELMPHFPFRWRQAKATLQASSGVLPNVPLNGGIVPAQNSIRDSR